ncbi:MAG: hypothetical protein IJ504_00915 [Bacteroidales bacterium]|nr:hypothetical protein [Bacteroidales bacterium]
MLQEKYTDTISDTEIGVRMNGADHEKVRECWVTSLPYDMNGKDLKAICKRYCASRKMKFISGRMSQPYEMHGWQHSPMYVFKAECTKKTSRLIYEFGN